jgi:GNAT superfamily N-acetyltransferase
MEILTYDEVDADGVTLLDWTCFRWHLTRDLADRLRRQDPWLPDSFALYAVEDDEAVAQVGTAFVDTDTVDGKETVGFIWGVCTLPGSARRGYATALMAESHRIMRERGVRIAVLGTRRSFVAYDLYHRLGYRDFGNFSGFMKRCSRGQDTDVSFTKESTPEGRERIYRRHVDGLFGFTRRFTSVMEVREMNFHDGPYTTGNFHRDGETIGYAIAKATPGMLNLLEVCTIEIEDVPDCIAAVERNLKPVHVAYAWTPRRAMVEQLETAGFSAIHPTWGSFMALDINGDLDIAGIESLYGVPDDRFEMTDLDAY